MYKNSKYTVLFPLLLAVGVVAGLLLGQFLGRNSVESQWESVLNRISSTENKLSYTLSLIEREYVDSISMDSLAEHVIPLLVQELDPHSVYIPRQEMASVNESLEGEFDGIGVVFNMATDTIIVLNVIPQGPSDKAGLKAGDRIVRVNDSLVAGRKIPSYEVTKQLRGKRGSSVRLTLRRLSIADSVVVDVVRDVIPIKSIEAAFMVNKSIGYIKLGQFSRTSYTEVMQAIRKLRAQGATKLLFDLRGNAGGYLDQAISIANEFLHEGQLIVYTENRLREQVKEFANGKGSAQDMEVVVLIDEASASSSEILAGALQDNDRGTIVGRRSFGKGLVQRQIPYADGSAIRLTTARYFTPTGRSIQKPYTLGGEADYEADMLHRYQNNEFFSTEGIHFADSLKRTTPKGKVVYGGGGIMPDLFVPADTTDVSRYFVEVAGRNILYRYTMEYADRHRKALDEVKTIPELKQLLDSDKQLLEGFVSYAARQGVKPNRREIAQSRKLIEAQLRAYISRNTVLEENGFYANIHPVDQVVTRSIEVLEKSKKK